MPKTFPILFRKTSTCYGGRDLNLDYLNEKSEVKSRNAQKDKIGSSLDYASKEAVGQVHAGGFLHKKLVAARKENEPAPSKLDNAIRQERIHNSWNHHLDQHGRPRKRGAKDEKKDEIIGHKFVLSFSKDFQDNLSQHDLNPDAVLHSVLKNVMHRYQDRFCEKGDSIGYAYGFHHDTDNLHVHVILHPLTEQGRVIGLSGQLKNKKQREHRRNDHIGFMKSRADFEATRWNKIMADPAQCEKAKKEQLQFQGGKKKKPEFYHTQNLQERQEREEDYKQYLLARHAFFKAKEDLKEFRNMRIRRNIGHLVALITGTKKPLFIRILDEAEKTAALLARIRFQRARANYLHQIRQLHTRKTNLHGKCAIPIVKKESVSNHRKNSRSI